MQAWFAAQPDLDPDKLVFLDETAAATQHGLPLRPRPPRGERCRLLVPQGHYKMTTVTAALRTTGLCALDLADGATNGHALSRTTSPTASSRCCGPATP